MFGPPISRFSIVERNLNASQSVERPSTLVSPFKGARVMRTESDFKISSRVAEFVRIPIFQVLDLKSHDFSYRCKTASILLSLFIILTAITARSACLSEGKEQKTSL